MSAHRHFMLYKPWGYLSQFVTNQKNNKSRLLGELSDFPDGTMAIGRLDKDSEGLLLLTTDGKVSNYITSSKVEKEYYAQVDGVVDEQAIAQLTEGVEIGNEGQRFITKAVCASIIDPAPQLPPRPRKIRDERHGPTSWLSITLAEGKFRQVRKMTAAVGLPTLRLVRMRIGPVHLGEMEPGIPQTLDLSVFEELDGQAIQ